MRARRARDFASAPECAGGKSATVPPPVEKHSIWFAIAIGLLGANFLVLVRPGSPPKKKAQPAPTYSVGQELDVAITLVSTDVVAISCASQEEVDGRHCAFEATQPETKWSKPVTTELPPEEGILVPYKTTDDVMFLVPGLFQQPALVERLKTDPPVFGVEHERFNVSCRMKVVGKVGKLDVRWAPNGKWHPATNVPVGTVSNCKITS